MKARITLFFMLFAAALLVGCAPGVGAESQPDATTESTDAGGDPVKAPAPTSTPWPHFGPPPVTADQIAPTVQSAPEEPVSTPEPTATPEPVDSLISTPEPAPVTEDPFSRPEEIFDTSGTFDPVLNYSYVLPLDWEEFVGTEQIVIAHESRVARVSVRERAIDRSSADLATLLSELSESPDLSDWESRSVADVRGDGSGYYRIDYVGARYGTQYVAIVERFLWGEMVVEVVTQADASAWAQDSNLRNTAGLIAAAFNVASQAATATAQEIQSELDPRFDNGPSNIYSARTDGATPTQLTCRQLFVDLLSDPVYTGTGEWQVYAVTMQGVQVWRIFEPGLTIVAAGHNVSVC